MVHTVYERTMKQSGLLFKDKDIMDKQNKVISFLIKKMGSNLIKGKSVMNVSLPVYIFDPRTLMQVLAFEISYAPFFLDRAFISVDKIEKLKWVFIFNVFIKFLDYCISNFSTPFISFADKTIHAYYRRNFSMCNRKPTNIYRADCGQASNQQHILYLTEL
jgi:hypothetical protein